jgi:Putative transposase
MRLNPHLHTVFLDGAWHEQREDLRWRGLGHLKTSEVGEVLLRAVGRIERHLRRKALLRMEDEEAPDDPEANLAASAVSGQTPPAGPQWRFGLPPLEPHELAYDKPLCASLDGFTLHAATRAGGLDPEGREALLRYVLRPPVANERVVSLPDGLVRIILKKTFADGTVAVDMDPLSLLSRLAASVPPPRHHTVIYAGVLAAASPWRPRLVPHEPDEQPATTGVPARPKGSFAAGAYRSWAELLRRTFGVDGLECPKCHGRMKLIAMLTERDNIVRYLTAVGEATELPRRSPNRGPPYWASTLLRRQALGRHPTATPHDDDPA